MEILNRALYEALRKSFHNVKVYRQGQKARFQVDAPLVFDDVPDTGVLSGYGVKGGERYVVTCPWCGRFKLWLSYLAGAEMETDGRPIRFGRGLVYCYRCHGQDDPQKLDEFWNTLKGNGYANERLEGGLAEAGEGRGDSASANRALDPGLYPPVVSLNGEACPETVRVYLRERGIDPATLEKYLGAAWSEDPMQKGYGAGRIIFPVWQNSLLVGWQGRALDKDITKRDPKYLFPQGCSPANWLHNLDVARWRDPVVLVEGVTDVYAAGPHAVGRFGKITSTRQLITLQHVWGNRSLVYIPDMDDPEAADKARTEQMDWEVRELFQGGVHMVALPPGNDPGNLGFEALRKAVLDQTGKKIVWWE